MIDPNWASARRLLLVRLDNLGDVLVTTPALRAVRQALPNAHLTLLCGPVGAQVGRLNPDLDELIVYDAPWMDSWNRVVQDPAAEQDLIQKIEAGRFDAAIIFTSFRQSSLPAAYICYLAGIPLRLAASVEGSGSLLTTRHKHASDCTHQFPHEVHRSLELLRAVGIPTEDVGLVLDVPEAAVRSARDIVRQCRLGHLGPTVVIHPGCSMPARTYPADLFRETVALLASDMDAAILVTGTAEEARLSEFVRAGAAEAATSLAGRIGFEVLCAVIQMADVTVCSNTGPAHISAAVGTPVVTPFALTNPPHQWAPWNVPHRQLYHDVPCRLCYERICPFAQECLRGVAPRQVVTAVRELLAGARELDSAAGRKRPVIAGSETSHPIRMGAGG